MKKIFKIILFCLIFFVVIICLNINLMMIVYIMKIVIKVF